MPLHARARRLGTSLRHEVTIDGRHRLVTDEPIQLGGDGSGPAPHELVPAALASCIATTLVMYAERKGWDLEGIEVDVTYEHTESPRRFDVEVRLPDHLSDDQLERLQRVAAACPVHRALEDGFEFEQRLVPVPRVRVADAA